MVEPGAVPGVDEMTTRAGAGFALSGGLAIDARAALDLLAGAADEGFDPVLVTEVNARSGLALSAALAARRPGVRAGTGIVPLGSRSEAALAMAATTVAQLAGAPFLLGVGTSSSQIVDGWHGQPYDASVATTRGRLRRLRSILDGERHGSFALARPRSGQVRVLLAALGPGMVELAFEASAGAMVNLTPPEALPAPRDGKLLLAYVWVLASDDAEQRARRELVAYLVAAPYARHLTRLGFGEVVRHVAGLHAEGRLREAPAALPRELVEAVYVRPDGLARRLAAYRRAGAHPVVVPVTGEESVAGVAGLLASPALRAPVHPA
jgi:alkanesulfonate monooxygenase SsuD/methylene tetrahydromethanopterin reductase-like flavin-dependent oxidoreductase (luciferase family)